MQFTQDQQHTLLNLARSIIRQELGDRSASLPDLNDPAYEAPGSCFVTLHTLVNHRLRGCIGQMQANGPLRESIVEMAQAVLDDPRFRVSPVTLEELPDLEIEITVLSLMEPAREPLDFGLLNHGIYLRCAGESGVFLPQVARETGWTKEQLLARLCSEKMGLPEDAWKRPDARLSRFNTTILGPEPFTIPR